MDPLTKNLQMIQIKTISIEKCKEELQDFGPDVIMPHADETVICTMSDSKGLCYVSICNFV